MKIKRREMIVSSAAAMVLPVSSFAVSKLQDDKQQSVLSFRHPRKYQIKHSIELSINDNDLTSLECWLPIPQNVGAQKIDNLETNVDVKYYRDKTKTTKIACFKTKKDLPAANSSFEFSASYELNTSMTFTDLEAAKSFEFDAYESIDVSEQFLAEEKHIEINLDEIRKVSRKLRDQHQTPVEFARAAYHWVLDHVTYKLIEGLGGARYCLEKAHGECGDYAALFIALCRAAKIPARPCVGFWARRKNDWHVWAEFLLPNGDWIPVDLSVGDRNARDRKFYFGNLDFERVILNHTYEINMEKKTEPNKAEFLQLGAYWYYASRLGTKPSATFSAEVQRLK